MLSAQEKIGRLEGLLARIKRNAALPRPARVAASTPAVEVDEPVDEQELAAQTPAPALAEVEASVDVEVEVEVADDIEFDEVDIGEIEEEIEEEVSIEVSEPSAAARPPELPPTGPRAAAAGLGEPTYDEEPGEEPLEAELPSGSDAGAIAAGHAGGPTMAQLGETVDLAGADASTADLELDTAHAEALPTKEKMEAALPRGEFHGAYDESLAPPPEAAQELEAHRQRQEAKAAAKRDARRLQAVAPSGERADVTAQRRPIPAGTKVAHADLRPASASGQTFVQMLDDSLRL